MYVCMHLSFDYAIDLWVFRENALVMLHFIITTHMCMELWRNILNMCIHTTYYRGSSFSAAKCSKKFPHYVKYALNNYIFYCEISYFLVTFTSFSAVFIFILILLP